MGGGGDDEAGVVAQDAQPGGDLGGVIGTGFEPQAEVGADEGGAQFGHQFFAGIGLVAEAAEGGTDVSEAPTPDIR